MKTLACVALLGLMACANTDVDPAVETSGVVEEVEVAEDPVIEDRAIQDPVVEAPLVEEAVVEEAVVEEAVVEEAVEVPDRPLTPVDQLNASIAEVAAREEHGATQVQVAHILIAFKGAERSNQIRSKDEAEILTADLLKSLEGGVDFDTLITHFSNDSGRGPYTMSTDGSTRSARSDMTRSFGDVAWRLEVGEIGVCAYHPEDSKFGWHIIKRLK